MKQRVKQKFSIRKFSIGTGSVLLGTFLILGVQDVAHASELDANSKNSTTANSSANPDAKAPVTQANTNEVSQPETTNKENAVAQEAPTSEAPATAQSNTEAKTTVEAAPTSTAKAEDREAKTDSAPQTETNTVTAASDTTSQPVVHKRSRRSATAPLSSEGVLEDTTTKATPNMDDPNGATVKSRDVVIPKPKGSNTIPTQNVLFEKNPDPNQYTFAITDLKNFNAAYNTKYYYRLSKPYDDSNNVTIELIDGNTNSVVETKRINSPGTVSIGETTLARAVAARDPQKAKYGHINFTFLQTLDSFQKLVSTIRGRFAIDDQGSLEDQRSGIQIYDVYNAANEGTTITDPQYYIPQIVPETAYYRVVNKNNPTYQANKTDVNAQTYEPNRTEKELARYTIKGMDGQTYTASNVRQFEGYHLYQMADPANMTGPMTRPYQVGLRYVDAETNNGGVKRIKEIVGEDGTTRIEVWTLSADHMSESAKNTGIDTTNYVKVYESTLKPGQRNMNDLGKQILIPGYTKPFLIQPTSAGDGAVGNLYAPDQTINGVQVGRGSNFRLQNLLTKAHPVIYYYTKIEPVEVTLTAKKVVKGTSSLPGGEIPVTNGQFTFNIAAGPNSPAIPVASQTKTNDANGTVTFDKIAFSKPGTYTYTITENKTNLSSNYDAEPLTVTATVKVTEENGVLKSNVSYAYASDNDNNQAFTNYYVAPKQLNFDVHFTKELAGRPLNNGEFHFNMKNADGEVIATGTNDAQGQINFTFIDGKRPTYTNTDAGKTFTYTVEEVPGTEEGLTYDPMKAKVTVNVTKSQDQSLHVLTVTSVAPSDTVFNNIYTRNPAKAKIEFTKVLAGKNLTDGAFEFTLSENGEVLQTVRNKNGKVTFEDISYDSEGSHTYTIKEVRGNDANYDYDPMEATVTVNVNENPSTHELSTVVEMPDDTEFNNYYVAPKQLNFDVQFTKELTGRPLNDGEFHFNMKNADGEVIATGTNNAQGIITFEFVNGKRPTYTNADAGKTFTYTVEEVPSDLENITSDPMKAKVTVNVTKSEDQGLHVLTVTSVAPADKEFNNVFTPPSAKAKIEFTKSLIGKDLTDGEFQFTISENGEVLQTVTNKGGKVVFDDLTYDEVGLHSYTIKEVAGTDPNIDYDSMVAIVTVNVYQSPSTGLLAAEIIPAADSEFHNYYVTPKQLNFDVQFTKELVGRDLKDQEFHFNMKDANGDVIATGTNNAEGKINFTFVDGKRPTYTNADAGKSFTYTVEEVASDEQGMTSDPMKAKVTVNVTKDLHVLTVTSVAPSDTEFNNIYTPTPAKAKIEFTKALTGKALTDGEFQFTLSENGEVLQTVSNKDGKVSFDEISYDEEGSHTYTIKEVVGTDANIDYDPMEATVTVNVSKNSTTGNYEAVVLTPDDTEFNNFYVAPKELNFDVEFTKALTGRDLKDQEFQFNMKDANGEVIATGTNNAAGKITFTFVDGKRPTYTNADAGKSFTYTVEEVPSTEVGVTSDAMKATVTVNVTKDLHVLTATSVAPADTEFNNTFVPPTPPTPVFQPEKFDLSVEKFDLTGNQLLDDDSELANKYADTNNNPYADQTNNNEAENINTKELTRGDKIVYQVWLDTTQLGAENKISKVGITDDYDETSVDVSEIKAYDSVTGQDVTNLFDITNENGVITATSKASLIKDHVLDNEQIPFGRYYKFDIVGSIKADAVADKDITNVANQSVQFFNPAKGNNETPPPKPSEKRVNKVKSEPANIQLKVTKRLEGGQLKGNDYTFDLIDLANPGQPVQEATNDADGNVNFTAIKYNQAGTYNYVVTEKVGTETNIDYDKMTVNVIVKVDKDPTTGNLQANVQYVSTGGKAVDQNDTEFNNTVIPPVPPTPVFQPEKFDLSVEKFDLTGNQLLDDDSELANKYADTNNNPYADQTNNNEAENINTKELTRGDKIVYQVWLDTTQLTSANNINQLGITDDYDETSVDVSEIKAYDGVTGQDVTDLFDITNENGVISATSKVSLIKDHIIDNDQMPFGRYYKFDIVGTIKADAKANKDFTNVANQSVQFFNPVKGGNEVPPPKPSQKRVNKVKSEPANIELKVTKKLEGGQLQGGDYTFVLTDVTNPDQPLQEATNDADGNVKFTPIKYKEVGTHSYLVTEKVGTDANVDYDKMSILVNVDVTENPTTGNLETAVKYISTGGKSIGANDTEFNNTVIPPTPPTPEFQPEKFDLSVPKFDLTGNKLLDDDSELANKYADTNSNPYADQANNNEPENINTKELTRGDAIVYQVWLDTTKLTEANKINKVGITDDYDETSVDVSEVKAYDGVTGQDVTDLFDITNENGVITATSKDSLIKDHVIDNSQMPFGRYYKFDIVGTVKADAVAGKDITNVANQSVQFFNPTKGGNEVPPPKPSEKRVNKVKPEPANIELKVTKRLEGGELKGGDFTFVLTDLANPDQPVQQATNDANGNVKFLPIKYKEVGTHSYLVTEKVGTDANVDYDTMSIVVNVDVTKDATTGNLKTEVKYVSTGGKSIGANDTEFNNTLTPPPPVVPPTPEFQPEKFDLSVPKFDLTGDKLLDDDSELANKYADTSSNPYADQANNNEPENINTKELNRGDAIVYQVWLDTTKLTEANKINKLGITDDYDEANVEVSDIKAYDSVTGQDVTHLFDITNENGVITATTKESLVTDHVIDNNQMPFGRYYKFDIVGTVKADAVAGKDFTNIANQSVQYFNPVKGGNEVPPPKPSEKRVNKVKPAPADIELKVTKKLEGGQLKGGDFTFVLTDLANPDQVVQEVTNDADGVVKFSTMKYKEVGTHSYLVTEKVGPDASVDYDTMSVVVNVDVTKDEATGNLKTNVKYVSTGGKSIGANDTEFNNTVKPPTPPHFQPEKFDLSVPKFDLTGNKLLDDDSELANKYADTNSNPYADQSNNNEPENINTKELNRGDAIVYQV